MSGAPASTIGRAARRYAATAAIACSLMLWPSGCTSLTTEHTTLPTVAPIEVRSRYIDATPVAITITAGMLRAPWVTTADDLRASPAVWRLMHLQDWDRVPEPMRLDGLSAMLRRYQPLLCDPGEWARMSASDWDRVPQPIRTIAYRRMIDYWVRLYGVGERYELGEREVADRVAAIVMSESWFEHRALFVNARGNRDIGLAAASDYARARVRRLHEERVIDLPPASDEDYENPWFATRFAAVWVQLLLDEARGDLDLTTRAYHRGIAHAGDELGTAYAATVQQRLARFIRNEDAPASWSYVWTATRGSACAIPAAAPGGLDAD
jgi:hypothetical protein